MIILLATQEVDLAIQPKDKKENPAQIDGVPVWSSSNVDVVALTPAADGLSCVAKAGLIGTAQVSVTADADLGAGVKQITGLLDVNVAAGEAYSMGVITGTPREQV